MWPKKKKNKEEESGKITHRMRENFANHISDKGLVARIKASLVAQTVKNLSAVWETQV